VAAPPAFQFLITHIEDIRNDPTGLRNAKEHGKKLKSQWDNAISELPTHVASAAEKTMNSLFIGWQSGHIQTSANPQSIHNGPNSGFKLVEYEDNVDYWQRIFAEDVDGLRDQTVAQEISKLKANPIKAGPFIRLVRDGAFAERFESLIDASKSKDHPLFIDVDLLYTLARQFHEEALKIHGIAAEIGRNNNDGFHSIWRPLIRKRLDKARHAVWVNAEIDRALDVSLRFANSIEYWWGGPNDDKDGQVLARRHLVEEFQKRLQSGGIDWLLKVLDPAWPWILNHLIVHQFHEPVFQPSEWSWILPTLNKLTATNPEFIPHVAGIVMDTTHGSAISEDGERSDLTVRWVLDKAFLDSFIPDVDQQVRFLTTLIRPNEFVKLDERANVLFRGLQKEFEELITSKTIKKPPS